MQLEVAGLLVPGRDCGTCGMCCKVFTIVELDKPAGECCRHLARAGGCAIHPERPEVCRTFFCHYLRNPHLGPEWKPEQAKFVLYTELGGRRMVVVSDPAWPEPWRQVPYYAQLKRWGTLGASRGRQVLVFDQRQCTAILPDRDEPLGIVGVGDEVIYRPGPGRITVDLRRLSSAPPAGPQAS